MPSPSRLEDKIEIGLRANGLALHDRGGNDNRPGTVYIQAVGRALTNPKTCVVYLQATLGYVNSVYVPYAKSAHSTTLMDLRYPLGGALLTGPKDSMQRRLEAQVSDFSDTLFLTLSRAKDKTFKKFPYIKESFDKSHPNG